MSDDRIFYALIKEAQFTLEMLCSGITQIRNANYARKGKYFQAFTSLSTGLERIGKLCLIIDYCIKNSGDMPCKNYFKKIGHDIEAIYKQLNDVKYYYGFELHFLQNLESQIHKDILYILSRFAKGDRYSNIDFIVNSRDYDDPIEIWYEKVDLYFFQNMVSQKMKEKIRSNAKLIEALMGHMSLVRHTGEDEKKIDTIGEASYRAGLCEAVGPYRQLYVFHVIRYFVEVLMSLQDKAMEHGIKIIPYFSKIFGVFYNDDKYAKSRKTWDKI